MADAVIEAKEGVTLRNIDETEEEGTQESINLEEAINNETPVETEAK